LRNIEKNINKKEVEEMWKRYNGLIRVEIDDKKNERRWLRRGWVKFERKVKIKEICWKIKNISMRDCELGEIVNSDISRRIRKVNGIK
jgi:hypothetical protein